MRFYILFAQCFDSSLFNYLMTKNVGIHLILVFCLWTFHFPFDFFIQSMLFLLEFKLTFLITDFKPLWIDHTVAFPYSSSESGRAMRRRLKIFLLFQAKRNSSIKATKKSLFANLFRIFQTSEPLDFGFRKIIFYSSINSLRHARDNLKIKTHGSHL